MKNVIHFTCEISCKVPYEDRFESFPDAGVLLLPDGYSDGGEPARLVISCHGAGGSVNTDDSQVVSQSLTKYLLANGFAVMDMAGIPARFCEKYGIDPFNNIGSPMAVDSYAAGYRRCAGGFNLKREVVVHGASMGGISSTNLVLSGRVPVLAQTGFCPVLDAYNEIYLHPWSGGLPKTALEKIYSLHGYDEQKIFPYNPAANPKRMNYPVPVEFWHCADDKVVSAEVTERFVGDIRAGGGRAVLHVLPAGGHEPQLYGGFVEPSGAAVFRGERLDITEAVEGAFSVISRYK